MVGEELILMNTLLGEGIKTMEKFPVNCNVTTFFGEFLLCTVTGYTFNSTGELILIITKYDFVNKTVTKDCPIHPAKVRKI